jgi:hypothetical protein
MHQVAKDLAEAETALGHDSKLISSFDRAEWPDGMEADIHVSHTHVPDPVRKAGGKLVWVGHGTPEHCFKVSSEEAARGGYGHGDCLMLIQWWMQHADAIVTFWPRHAWFWSKMCDKHTQVDCIPLGVNLAFWSAEKSAGKYVGNPSVLTCENCHDIKWPLDLAVMWEDIYEEFMDAQLHFIYLPTDQHRIWFPLMNRIGTTFKAYASNKVFDKPNLRNAFKSVDYVTSFVRYGDFNKITLEAKASGAKIISFYGNPYADFWIPEGDQRVQIQEMLKIFRGETAPRQTDPVPDISETAQGMIEIYSRILEEK